MPTSRENSQQSSESVKKKEGGWRNWLRHTSHTSRENQVSHMQESPLTSPPETDAAGPALEVSHRGIPSSSLTQSTVTNPSSDIVTIQAEVWNDAYDKLQDDNPRMIDTYERILSGQLKSGNSAKDVVGCPENVIRPRDGRQDQLKKLVQEGESKSEPVATFKGKANDVIERFKPLRGVISEVVKINPVASVAWVGITAVLDVSFCHVSQSYVGAQVVLPRSLRK